MVKEENVIVRDKINKKIRAQHPNKTNPRILLKIINNSQISKTRQPKIRLMAEAKETGLHSALETLVSKIGDLVTEMVNLKKLKDSVRDLDRSLLNKIRGITIIPEEQIMPQKIILSLNKSPKIQTKATQITHLLGINVQMKKMTRKLKMIQTAVALKEIHADSSFRLTVNSSRFQEIQKFLIQN